jgi:hypothetical protein
VGFSGFYCLCFVEKVWGWSGIAIAKIKNSEILLGICKTGNKLRTLRLQVLIEEEHLDKKKFAIHVD